MAEPVDFPKEPPSRVVELGPKTPGNVVIVDGRAIRGLNALDNGDEIEFILDNRFSYSVPRDWSKLFAAAMAQAMAIGAGYSHLGADTKGRPFAARVATIDLPKQ